MSDLDINEIIKCLPHRYPFLLLDRILEYRLNESILAIKNVTHNEPFFAGHFPIRPIMPGVLIMESMAQAAGVLAFKTWGGVKENELFFLAGIDEARFKRIVEPGDQLKVFVEVLKAKNHVWKVRGVASVDDEMAVTATLIIVRGTTP